ncbi:hypothetical protein ACVI1L_000708 [Bradyrhizobium sp. USDA 4516]
MTNLQPLPDIEGLEDAISEADSLLADPNLTDGQRDHVAKLSAKARMILEEATGHRHRCPYCYGKGTIERPPLKNDKDVITPLSDEFPSMLPCPVCHATG